jgi:hypothetical protein
VQAPAAASPVSDLLEVLLANGTITQQQYDSLKQRYAAKHEAHMAVQAEQAVQPAPVMIMPANVVTAMDNAVGFHVGRFDLTFSGDINGFYVHNRADRTPKDLGACVFCLASADTNDSSSIRNGLLPGDLTIKVSTKEKGYDVAFVFGIWPGIDSLMGGSLNLVKGGPTGFGTSGIDFRQQYLTVGRPKLGTFKFGRDLGLFGQEAILNDMTLLGAGTPNISNGAGAGAGPGSVTLGRIGLGYIYTDWMPQISYTSPSSHGLQVGAAIIQPLTDVFGGAGYSAQLTGYGQPQFQTKVTYTAPTIGGLKAKFWTNYLTQSMEADHSDLDTAINNGVPLTLKLGDSVQANAVDYGTKLSSHGFDFVGYGYNGWGVGTEGLLFLATSPTGATRPSQGYYLQGMYTLAKKWTLGASYGQSNLSLAGKPGTHGETLLFPAGGSGDIVRNNSSYVGQARYSLTSNVILLGEYTHTSSESQAQTTHVTSDSIAVGSIAFF